MVDDDDGLIYSGEGEAMYSVDVPTYVHGHRCTLDVSQQPCCSSLLFKLPTNSPTTLHSTTLKIFNSPDVKVTYSIILSGCGRRNRLNTCQMKSMFLNMINLLFVSIIVFSVCGTTIDAKFANISLNTFTSPVTAAIPETISFHCPKILLGGSSNHQLSPGCNFSGRYLPNQD